MRLNVRLPVVFAALAAAFVLPGVAKAENLRGIVGPGFEITLLHEDGRTVTQLAPGTHTIQVQDRSADHNFHLTGPGVNRATGVAFVGSETWTVTLGNGIYTYLCDPHPTEMRGTFRIGTVQPPPPPPPPSPPAAPRRTPTLVAVVGPGARIALTTTSGRRVTSVKAGRYRILIRDRSKFHNFHLVGPGVNKKTSVGFLGRTAWTVRFRKGKRYRYVCDPHSRGMRGSVRAR